MWRVRCCTTATAVTGVLVRNEDGLGIIHAPSVILATGGLGHVYAATTNPGGSTGDGIALALWAGVPVSRHRVRAVPPDDAVRRERPVGGARSSPKRCAVRALYSSTRQGNSVTEGVHPMGDLAPRDVVAAAIDARLSATG